jgi:hypothetical protein
MDSLENSSAIFCISELQLRWSCYNGSDHKFADAISVLFKQNWIWASTACNTMKGSWCRIEGVSRRNLKNFHLKTILSTMSGYSGVLSGVFGKSGVFGQCLAQWKCSLPQNRCHLFCQPGGTGFRGSDSPPTFFLFACLKLMSTSCVSQEVFWVILVAEVKILGPLSRSIRSVKYRVVTKIITRMDKKLQDESIKFN